MLSRDCFPAFGRADSPFLLYSLFLMFRFPFNNTIGRT